MSQKENNALKQLFKNVIAQLQKGKTLPLPMSVLDMTLNHLMAKLKPWRFGVPLYCYCTQVHSDLEW